MRQRYTARFRESNLHATILKRIVMGHLVVDHERVKRSFPEGPGVSEAVAIYEVQGNKITHVWLIPGPRKLDSQSR